MESAFLFMTIILYILGGAGYIVFFYVQKDRVQEIAYRLFLGGFLANLALIAVRFSQSGRFPVSDLCGLLTVAACLLSGLYLVYRWKFRVKVLGIIAAPLAAIIMIISAILPPGGVPEDPAIQNVWVISHIIFIFIGEASLALAFGSGILYLLQENAIKNKKRGFFYRRLPSLDLLDYTGYTCIVIGFASLTVGLIIGFIYAKSTWGRFWSWDPKEVWSGITWLIYAALLHERIAVGWRGRRAAIMSIVGFAVLMFTFLGVNFFMEGHHVDFTRW